MEHCGLMDWMTAEDAELRLGDKVAKRKVRFRVAH